jgi:hypothetical protein
MNNATFGKNSRRKSLALALLLAMVLVITACGRSGDGTMTGNTMTEQQAAQQVQANIHAAAAQLPATARLEQQLTNSVACGDPTDPVRRDLVTAGSAYQVHNLDPAQYPHLFDQLRTWWTAHDFRILDDKHLSTTSQFLSVENNKDGFQMAIQSNDNGGLFLMGSSPCVWPTGKPGPTS